MHAILANSGSAIMIATFVHLLVGNLLIGVFEGLLVSKIFKTPRFKSILMITLANYASAWLGYVALGFSFSSLDLTIETATLFVGSFMIMAFILTLVIEMPFLTRLTHGLNPTKKTLWKNLTLIHLASYSFFILPWYLFAGNLSLLRLDVVEVGELSTEPLLIAYLSPDKSLAIIYDLSQAKESETMPSDSTFLRYGDSNVHKEDLKKITPVGLDPEKFEEHWQPIINKDSIPAHRLRKDETLEFKSDGIFYWPKGLTLRDSSDEVQQYFRLEAPKMIWGISCVTQIRDGLILFQLGGDQVCLADFRKMKISLLGRGSRPVVVTKVSAP